MSDFDLFCPSEFVKEVTSFKLEPSVDINFEILGSNSKRGIINYHEYTISKNYFSLCNIFEALITT